MVAALDDLALLKHHDGVGVAHRGKPVGDDEYRAPLHQLIHAPFNKGFRTGINGACGFVKDQHRRIRHRRTGNGEQLPLSLRQVGTVCGENGVVALGQVGDEEVGIGELCRRLYFCIRSVKPAVADVLPYRAGEQVGILQHRGKACTQGILFDVAHGDAVIGDLALLHIVKAVDEVGDGGLAGTGGAHKGDLLPRIRIQGYVFEDGLFPVIAEGDILEADIALHLTQGEAAVFLGDLPCPCAGALRALRKGAVRMQPCVDHGHIALVHLLRRVEQRKDALCACKGAHHVVHLLGKLADGLVEAACVLQKCADGADARGAAHRKKTACRRREGIGHMAEVVHDGSHQVCPCVGGGSVVHKLLVELVEGAVDGILVAEDLDHLLPLDHLLHIAVHFGKGALPCLEVFAALAGDGLGDEEHHAQHQKGKGGQNGAEHHHHGERAHDGHHGVHELRNAL